MRQKKKINNEIISLTCCPVCHNKLEVSNNEYVCVNNLCNIHYPTVDGIPILLNESTSVFTFKDFTSRNTTYFYTEQKNTLRDIIFKFTPTINKNVKASENFKNFEKLLLQRSNRPKVLVLGGSIIGEGMESLINNDSFEMVETDISFGPRTNMICDAHEIPFEDNSFDAVIVQAVLEHLLDPYRCVEEIYRVLTVDGIVYAETPFMQQVHGGRYDFTRFTYLGHRRLFRKFEEIDSGPVCGPGMALAWSVKYFFLSFPSFRALRFFLRFFSSITTFFLKYFDTYLIDKPGTLDSASAFYFMGKKGKSILSDKDLIKRYKI